MAKYILRATASETDEIAGFAMRAGSKFIFFTKIGIMLPIILANITMKIMDTHTVKAIPGL